MYQSKISFLDKLSSRLNSSWQLPFAIITLIYWTVNIFLYLHYGVKYVNDSHRYVEYATNLSNGFYFDPHNFWYISYAALIFVVRLLSDELAFLIAVQYLLSYIATLALYHTSLAIFDDALSALLSALCFVLFIEIPTWNSYVLAESIYISCICFTLVVLVQFAKLQTLANFFLVLIAVTFTSLIKPTGIAMISASMAALLIYPIRRLTNKWLRQSILVLSVAITLALANRMLATFNVIENYQIGEVIYAITTLPPNPDYENMVVTPPSSTYIPPQDDPPLLKIVSFYFHHPLYSLRLFLTKLFYFLVHIRPYWSSSHNAYSLFFLLPTYYFFTKAISKEKIRDEILVFVFTYLTIQILSVCITSEDWDGRFLMPLLPVLFVFSARGLVALSGLVKHKNISAKR